MSALPNWKLCCAFIKFKYCKPPTVYFIALRLPLRTYFWSYSFDTTPCYHSGKIWLRIIWHVISVHLLASRSSSLEFKVLSSSSTLIHILHILRIHSVAHTNFLLFPFLSSRHVFHTEISLYIESFDIYMLKRLSCWYISILIYVHSELKIRDNKKAQDILTMTIWNFITFALPPSSIIYTQHTKPYNMMAWVWLNIKRKEERQKLGRNVKKKRIKDEQAA